MDAHDKECALAALAILLERAQEKGNRTEAKELRADIKRILAEPVETE